MEEEHMTDQALSERDISTLRSKGLLYENETAIRSNDIVLAVNLVTSERRVLSTEGLLLESSRKLLKD
jgi:hypothetical protein